MQLHSNATRGFPELDISKVTAATISSDDIGIDASTLAKLDTGLFRCLLNLGTPRQRVCSALCLSYAEYDYIVNFLQEPE
jgi:hypothetical protein